MGITFITAGNAGVAAAPLKLPFPLAPSGDGVGPTSNDLQVRRATHGGESRRRIRRRVMRELIGKIPTKDPTVTEVVYLAEIVRCLECQQTVPMGIEVVTIKKTEESREVLRHVFFCRGHGFDYETKAQSLPIRSHEEREALLRFDNPVWGMT
jgi:hypothetical protein